MSGVASGKLRHRVQIQRPVPEQDLQTGEPITDWQAVADTWADISPVSGREFLAAGAEQSEVRAKITIRHRDGVDATMRVVYRGLYYAIHAVLPDADSGREHLTLMVAEGVRLEL